MPPSFPRRPRSQPAIAARGGRRIQRLRLEPLERRDCPAPLLSIQMPTDPIVEGDRATFTVRLAQPSTTPQRIAISAVAETATLGRDFMFSNPTQLLFAPGQTERTFSVQTFTDATREPTETFLIRATPLTTPNAATITARASIFELAQTTVTASDLRITEGNSGTKNATFTLTLGGQPTVPVFVQYSTQDGSATAGSDYEAKSGSVFFNPGQTSKTVSIVIKGDTVVEPDETFRLLLSSPTRGCTVLTPSVTGTIVNDEADTPGFQITLTYTNPNLPAVQKQVFQRAANRLQQIIVGDVPGVTLPNGQFIDDVEILVTVEPMSPFLNGYARTLQTRTGPGGLPYQGEIFINASKIGDAGIYHTIIHECLHAFGFSSTFFQTVNKVSGLGTTQPLFTGTNAIREYATAFSLTAPAGVPLYGDLSAPGSYGSHWDTTTIGTEIMSVGWDTTSTALRPFSRITVGALQDFGYQVNYAKADAYTKPPIKAGTPPAGTKPKVRLASLAPRIGEPVTTAAKPVTTAPATTPASRAAVAAGKTAFAALASAVPSQTAGVKAGQPSGRQVFAAIGRG